MAALRREVFVRDGWVCLAFRADPGHECAGQWGKVSRRDPRYRECLTLEHVRMEAGGSRHDRPEFCVTLCWRANVEHWGSTTENRAWLNATLDAMYPDRRSLL